MATRVELYRFTSEFNTWRYTSADRDVETESELFEAGHGLSRGRIASMGSIHKSDVEIQAPRDNPIVGLFTTSRPESMITTTIFKADWPDLVPKMIWKGRIVGVSFKSDTKAVITNESVFTSLGRPGLRAMYQLICRHGLYRPGCGVNPDHFRVAGDVAAVDGAVLTVPAASGYPIDYFKAGYILSAGKYAMVTGNSGNQVTIDRRIIGKGPAWLYPGCDHTRAHCHQRFNNILNFGGFPWIPLRTPFAGGESFIPGGTVGYR